MDGCTAELIPAASPELSLGGSLGTQHDLSQRTNTKSWFALIQDGTQKSQKVFMNIPTEVGATEAEAIGKSEPFGPCLCFVARNQASRHYN